MNKIKKPSLKSNQRIAGRMNSDWTYNYTGTIESTKRRLGRFQDGITAIKFLDLLSDHGLSKGRVVYGSRLTKILQWFENLKITLKDATRDDCKECLKNIAGNEYEGKTNRAFAEALKRLIHCKNWRDWRKEGRQGMCLRGLMDKARILRKEWKE